MAESLQRARERALFRYRSALERGDLATLAEIMKLAEHDSMLVAMISELHELEDAPQARKQGKPVAIKPERGVTFTRIKREPSPNGWPPKSDDEEEASDMSTHSDVIRRGNSRFNAQFLTAVAAAVILVVIGAVVIEMISGPIKGYPALFQLVPTAEPLPAGCQASGSNDPQAKSIELADASAPLLKANPPDTELATLLAICSLQTGYSPEGDAALQRALDKAGQLPALS